MKLTVFLSVLLAISVYINYLFIVNSGQIKIGSNYVNFPEKIQIVETHNPMYLEIPSVNIRSVTDKNITDDTSDWKVYKDRLAFALGSNVNYASNNLIIYGHATSNLLKNLKYVKMKDEIIVYTDERIYKYSISGFDLAYPYETEKIYSYGDTNLSIFTCIGPNDEQRLVIKAKLVDEIKLNTKEVI